MDPVGRQKPIGYALGQTVFVERIAEICVGIGILLSARRRGHPDLGCGRKPLENFVPCAVVTRAAPVALIHHDQVEKLPGLFAIEAGSALVPGHRLVGREIHVAALDRDAARNTVPRLVEGQEILGHGIVDEDVPVGQEQDLRPQVVASRVPAGLSEIPENLKGDRGLAGVGAEGQQHRLRPYRTAWTAWLTAIS